jgi:hypothetical protein
MKKFTELFEFKIELPFEEGKTYDTKLPWKFTISKIGYDKSGKITSINGYYENNKALCPINIDRLIPHYEIKLNEYYKSVTDFANIIKGSYTDKEKEIIAEHIKNLFL